MRYRPYLAGIGFSIIFGFSFMFTRGALDYLAPFHLLGLRFGVAATLMVLLRLVGLIRFSVKPADYRALLAVALFSPLIYFPIETVGIQLTSSSYAGMFIAVIPIVTVLAALLIREYPARLQLPFIFASVAGVIFIFLMQNNDPAGSSIWGSLALLGAVMAASFYNVASRSTSRRYSPIQRTWVMMTAGAVFFNSVALAQHAAAGNITLYFQPLTQAWPAIAYLGVLSSVVAFFLINYTLSYISAVQGSVFANMVTVIAIAAGVFILGEDFHWYHILGAAAILAGVWGTNRFAPAPAVKAETARQVQAAGSSRLSS